jgi:Calcium binding
MTNTRKRKTKRGRSRLSTARLDRLAEEAVVDCYNESEQRVGLYTMIENNLALPFETTVLGVPVIVERADLTRSDEIVAVCRRARMRQTVPILDLALPLRAGCSGMDRRLSPFGRCQRSQAVSPPPGSSGEQPTGCVEIAVGCGLHYAGRRAFRRRPRPASLRERASQPSRTVRANVVCPTPCFAARDRRTSRSSL